MKPTEQTCDTGRIDEYLDERMSDSVLIEFEEHLGNCDRCQNEIQRRAAEPEMWQDAVELLGAAICDSSPDSTQDPDDEKRRRLALGVLDLLTPTDDPEMLGRIGDYEVSGVVGIGGMGAVLKGFDQSLRRVVAIKVMAPHLADNGSARARFQREARAAAAITHDNVIDTYGVSESNGLPYLVMPFARGPSLQKRIDESGPLSAIEVVRIGRQIAAGLAAAHEQGLVHRDVKPANILLNEGIERLWITDFGVARAMDDASMTQTGVIAGTPQYMSPEQARGETVDHRSDLFSIGSVLYTACTGRPPFRSEAAYGILRRITDTDPRPIREINSDIPDWLCQIIERLMAKHPADRYQSASEVADLLEDCLAHLQQPTQIELPACVRLPSHHGKVVPKSKRKVLEPVHERSSRLPRLQTLVMLTFVLLTGAFLAWRLTEPANIAGRWTGEKWKSVSLSPVEGASGWYNGSFTDAKGQRGAVQLEWSRLQRRYNGRWKVGADRSGSLTLRVKGNEVRGAVAVDQGSPLAPESPRLREFSWSRSSTETAEVPKTQQSPPPTMGMRGTPIQAPISGRITRLGKGIQQNAQVKKGEILCELQPQDRESLNQLKNQEAAASRQVEAAQILVSANERSLEATGARLDAFRSQLQAYEKVKQQLNAAADGAVASTRSKIDVAKAELTQQKAALDLAQNEFTRQKALFDQKGVSQKAFEKTQRTLDGAQANFQKAQAELSAAESDLVAKLNDQKAKQSKAQVDVDSAKAQVSSVVGDLAKAEREVASAKLQLAAAEKSVIDLQVRIAQQDTIRISAPVSGLVIQWTEKTILKEGDVICVIQPNSAEPKASSPKTSSATPPQEAPVGSQAAQSDGSNVVSRLPGMSELPILETIDAAVALRRRIHELQDGLQAAEQSGNADKSVVAKLNNDLAACEFERETAVTILKAQLDAAKRLRDSQSALAEMAKRHVESGDAPANSLLQARQAAAVTDGEIQQLELLLNYYSNLAKKKSDAREKTASIAVELLKIELAAAKKTMEFEATQREYAKRRFEVGESKINDVLSAEMSEFAAAAQVKKVEALLAYYENVSKNGIKPSEEVVIQMLVSQLDAAKAKLFQAQHDLKRQKKLYEAGVASAASLQAAEAAVSASDAAVKQISSKFEEYQKQKK